MSLGAGLFESPRPGDTLGVPLRESRARVASRLELGISDGLTVESKISTSQNAAATGNYLELTSILLPIGTWDISGLADHRPNGATFTVGGQCAAAITTTSASSAGSTSAYSSSVAFYQTTTTTPGQITVPRVVVDLAVETRYYLNVYAEYSAGTPQWRGSISAIRISKYSA